MAAHNHTMFGIGVVPSNSELAIKLQSYQESITKFKAVKRKPTNVITFGATHRGKYCNLKRTINIGKWKIEKLLLTYLDDMIPKRMHDI